ncbi:DNA gyrase subunit A [Massilibacteroides sp.]|uniref:DNA gyrase subunit A n=1 Tax=Massilibacteroides sp. TaxID=2034766 RepID=UPI00261C3F77|nr:DNA gyrase subunit A [Massilibacteroides sp.]MDD4516350.1 DNA gyrase subunit A [Massilibacteroides sp.]
MLTLEQAVKQNFLDYSAFVLRHRVVPDSRDGLRYTQRQILYSQKKEKLDSKHPFKKSQKSVAAALAFCYVHGDSSCYEQIIRMSRKLNYRYLLEDIKGVNGNPTRQNSYAASRYTECRLSKLADHLMVFLNEEGIIKEWEPTYDEEDVFPVLFPSLGFWNGCNGNVAIGSTLVSSIPQFNIKEINAAIIDLIRNPKAEVNVLPDFASGGVLLNPQTTLNTLRKGKSKSALLRGKTKLTKKGDDFFLEITELPYGVYTETLVKELEQALDSSEKVPFTDVKDFSKSTVSLLLVTRDPEGLLKWLCEKTSFQKHFTIQMTMLKDGKVPKIFSLKEALLAHIAHAEGVLMRHFLFEANRLRERADVARGLLKAYSILDDVIKTIKASSGRADSITKLIQQYSFLKTQAEAIVDLRLHRLSNLDIQKIANELEEIVAEQERISSILRDRNKSNEELIKYYVAIAEEYGDSRRTQIYSGEEYESSFASVSSEGCFYIAKENDKYQVIKNLIEIDEEKAEISDETLFDETTNTEDDLLEQPKATILKVLVADDILVYTNLGRGFCINAEKLKVEDDWIPWEKNVKLHENEKIIFVSTRQELQEFDNIVISYQEGISDSKHISFFTIVSTPRGRKLFVPKGEIVGLEPK